MKVKSNIKNLYIKKLTKEGYKVTEAQKQIKRDEGWSEEKIEDHVRKFYENTCKTQLRKLSNFPILDNFIINNLHLIDTEEKPLILQKDQFEKLLTRAGIDPIAGELTIWIDDNIKLTTIIGLNPEDYFKFKEEIENNKITS